jgi:hypothetical protein
MRWVTSLAGLGVALVLVTVFIFVNGGYVYRTQCPRVGGSVETDWTYQINAILPYIGYSRSNCAVHTATRVALDAVGVWKIDDAVSSSSAMTDHTGDYTAAQIDGAKANCVQKGQGVTFCGCAIDELVRRFSPREFALISVATKYEELPGDLARRAQQAFSAVNQGCH